MDAEVAIETKIEPHLVDAVGRHVTNSLLALATVEYAVTDGNAVDKYRALVHSICSDDRVVSAWGDRGAAKQEEEWKGLVTTASE